MGELVATLGTSQPAASKHLRVLRDAQLVTARVDAQHRFYRIQPEPLLEIDTWLAPYRALWESSLDALELHLEHMAVEGNPRPPGSDTGGT